MDRLTNDNPQGNFETMLNYVFGKDGYAYIRSDGESDEPVLLTEWARKQCLERHCDVAPDGTPDDVDQSICDCAFYRPECPIFLAYTFACQAVHMRDRCKAYEDAIPFPDLPRAAELVKADDKGLCVVLPCEVGDDAYFILPCLDGCLDDMISEPHKITEVGIKGFWTSAVPGYDPDGMDDFTSWNQLRKTAFLPRAEAEEALDDK
ncbi:hypothetical protein [Intestinibacillus massiliensis]